MATGGADQGTVGSAPLIRFEAVSKRFGVVAAVETLTLDIAQGEFFALLGPSGCGKTTLLRMLAGFETPSEGRIFLGGEDIVPVPPHRRPVNMMFQSYALFPHLTVEGNIAFGLRQENVGREEIAARVAEMLDLTRLQGFGGRKIHQLSGGQRQRVALARSLIKRPRVLLLDEPLAALDKKLRAETQFELMELQRKLGTTFVIVTHDQEEAMIVADRIAVMNQGRLMQVATPTEIYEQPNSRWVADFIGEVTIIEGKAAAPGTIDSTLGTLAVANRDTGAGKTVWLALRPEKIGMSGERPAGARLGGQSRRAVVGRGEEAAVVRPREAPRDTDFAKQRIESEAVGVPRELRRPLLHALHREQSVGILLERVRLLLQVEVLVEVWPA